MKRFSNLIFSLLVIVGVLFGNTGANAQGSGLQVSPVRTELIVEAGQSETFSVDLNNVTNGPITASPVVYDFEPTEDGSPRIITDESAQVNPSSIKSFLGRVENTPLAPGEKKTARFTVNIPRNQAAGAYYGIILFNAQTGVVLDNENQSSGGQVALSAGVGHIVLIQVPGEITDKMELTNVTAGRQSADNKLTTGSIFSNVPTQIQITLKNTGNSILKPFGNITVEKGGQTLSNIQINNADVKANLLPNSSRVFTEELKDLKGFGRFTITVNAAYGNGGDILTQKLNVWVIPAWLAVSVGAGVVALAAVVFVAVRKFRK